MPEGKLAFVNKVGDAVDPSFADCKEVEQMLQKAPCTVLKLDTLQGVQNAAILFLPPLVTAATCLIGKTVRAVESQFASDPIHSSSSEIYVATQLRTTIAQNTITNRNPHI